MDFLKKIKSNEQGRCPFCNSYNLEYGAINLEGEMAYFKWQCQDCKKEGEEWYSMNFDGHNVIDDNGDIIELEDNVKSDDEDE